MLRQAKCLQGRSVDCGSNGQAMVRLKCRQGSTRLRPQASISRSGVVTLPLQCDLHIHDDLIWGPIAVTVNRPVIWIIGRRVVSPCRIPVTCIPVPPSAQHKDDSRMMVCPPTAVMPLPVVIVKRGVVRPTETSVPPIVDDAGICCAIDRHIPSQSEISPLARRQVPASVDSLNGLRSALITQSCRLHAVASYSVWAGEISLAINRRTVAARHPRIGSCRSRAAYSCCLHATASHIACASDRMASTPRSGAPRDCRVPDVATTSG